MRIAALATGVGNIRSVLRALDRAAPGPKEIIATATPEVVRSADVIVAPGQGSFGSFATALDGGLRDALLESMHAGVPYLGICLGLQILFDASDEAPGARGLGILRGHVRRLEPGIEDGRPRALPHIGWNLAEPRTEDALVTRAHYYFAHSYAASPEEPEVVLAHTGYGETFASAVRRDNIVGVQFHPEKSQREGLALLERFFLQIAGTSRSTPRTPGA